MARELLEKVLAAHGGLDFNGYALWTYLTTPFHFAMPGFAVEEIEPWREDDELWRGLRVTYPSNIASHSKEQDF